MWVLVHRQPQADSGQDRRYFGKQRLGLRPCPGHQNHEVVRVPEQPIVGQPFLASSPPLLGGRPWSAGCLGEVLVEHRQRHIGQQRRDHAPNAMGNFCFDVTLSYRRLERQRRVRSG